MDPEPSKCWGSMPVLLSETTICCYARRLVKARLFLASIGAARVRGIWLGDGIPHLQVSRHFGAAPHAGMTNCYHWHSTRLLCTNAFKSFAAAVRNYALCHEASLVRDAAFGVLNLSGAQCIIYKACAASIMPICSQLFIINSTLFLCELLHRALLLS